MSIGGEMCMGRSTVAGYGKRAVRNKAAFGEGSTAAT